MNTNSRGKFLQVKEKLRDLDASLLKEIEDIENVLNADGIHLSFYICCDVWWTTQKDISLHPGMGLLTWEGVPIRLAGRNVIRQFLAAVKGADLYAFAIDAYIKEMPR